MHTVTIPPQWQMLIDTFLERNSKINLSAIRDPQGVRLKHISDTLVGAEQFSHLFTPGDHVLDLGTGGGFPLLPLAISFPGCKFTGLDARKKKTVAINAMIETLGLQNCTTIRSRVEDHKQRYDIITARAVAYADQLMEWSLPRLKRGGSLLRRKGYTLEEDAEIRELCHRFDCTLIKTYEYTLDNDTIPRIIYHITK